MAVTGVPGSPRSRVLPLVISAALLFTAGCRAEPAPPASPASPPLISPPAAATGVDAPGTGEFPNTAQRYAEATVAAWAGPDLIRLTQLTTSAVHEQIIEIPGPPDQSWTFIRCEPTEPEISECTFHNADGDQLALAVSHDRLAGPQGVREAAFEPTTYPADAIAYVQAFVQAWQDGNPRRMSRLAVANAASALHQLPAAGATGYEVTGSDDHVVMVEVGLTPTGTSPAPVDTTVTLRVSPSRLGGPLAIRLLTLPELG